MMNGMADNGDDYVFFDDDFPDIPDDELQRLEQDAITFTQQEAAQHKPRQDEPSRRIEPPSRIRSLAAPSFSARNVPKGLESYGKGNQQDSSDGTIFDEDGLPLVVEEQPQVRSYRQIDETAQREQWRVNRFAQPQVSVSTRPALPPQKARQELDRSLPYQTSTTRPGPPRPLPPQQEVGPSTTYRNVEEDALRARISELTRERDELTSKLHESKEEVVARKGEIANLRSKQTNDTTSMQRQIAALQKLKQEESERHAATIQSMHADSEKVASEIQFLKQELKEESRKAQTYQRQLKDRPLNDKPNNVNTTPKRNHAFRDGFDDDEMMIVSPAKSGRKSKQATPTANRKRKQPSNAEQSVQPLALRLSGAGIKPETDNSEASNKPGGTVAITHKDHTTERHLRLIQKVTNFRPSGGQETLIELLFKVSFASEVKKTFGTIVVDAMAKLKGPRLPTNLLQIFIDLWSRAVKEKYYPCISLLVEIVSFVLDQDPFVIDKSMLSTFLPILEATITVNGKIRFQTEKDALSSSHLSRPSVDPHINNTSCLELLYTISCLSYDDKELIDLFWRSLSTDFVLMMLNRFQPMPDITLMLRILATSILPDTFSNITEASEQARFEAYVCDRVCYLLLHLTQPDANKLSYSQKQHCLLRQESLDFLTQLTLGSSPNPFNPSEAHNYGTKFLFSHPSAISRLVRCIYDELAEAYLMTATQYLHIKLVNTAVRILHFVLFSPAGTQLPWQSKFSAINGGPQKFRVAMARLAYAEGTEPGIDAGITEDTVRMATELLLESVTPDELEDFVKVFEGDGSGSTRRTSAIGSTQR